MTVGPRALSVPARVEVVTTRGGARAVRDLDAGEVMHPVIGPVAEAESLYVGASNLARRLTEDHARGDLVLYDVGLGAGSNAVAAFWTAMRAPVDARRLTIVSYERSLDALELALAPENRAAFQLAGEAGDAATELLARGESERERVRWVLVTGELPATLALGAAHGLADVVFWDPFSPKQNPELWGASAFTALRPMCRAGATVHTYSRATAVRAALVLGGFAVGTGQSTGEKESTTVAAVDASSLASPLGPEWLTRLARSSAPLPPDAPPDAMARIAASPQFRREL